MENDFVDDWNFCNGTFCWVRDNIYFDVMYKSDTW